MMSNRSHRLYVGATTDLVKRVREHKSGAYPNGFTARYEFYRLVYYEAHPEFAIAIKRERQIKSWRRDKKVALIQAMNPRWNDLSVSFDDLLLVR